MNLSQLTQVQKNLRTVSKNRKKLSAEETLQVLEKIENQNSFETHKTLAIEMDLPIQTHEKIRPQADESVRIELTLTAEQFAILQLSKNLLSHVCPDGNWAEVITAGLAKFNKSKLEGRGSKTIKERDLNPNLEKPEALRKRKYIPIKTKRQLFKTAEYSCQFQDPQSKKKCGSQFQLQIDHRRPLALGGGENLENLRVLCRTHNIHAAKQAGLTVRYSLE